MTSAQEQHETLNPITGIDAQATSKDFEDFIYLISHDVRNSVRALIELPQWIVEDLAEAGVKVEGSVAETIDMMNTHTGRLDRMLVDLLSFSRIGRMQEIIENDVDIALTEVLEEIRVPAGFTILPSLETNIIYMGDRDLLTLLTQLILNAIKHHDKDHGKILISLQETNGNTVLQVTDDGPGIEPQFHERIFGAMTTLKPRDEVEGSGMGLAIVRKIAGVYQGRVEVGSGLGAAGTTITVTIPKPD